jgi:hypothetical protein
MKIEQLKNQINEHTSKIAALKKQMMEELRKDFHGALVELFDAYPFVTAVHFTAFTPFFADGDECTFGSHHDDCGFNGYESYGDDTKSERVSNAFGNIEGENILENSRETIYVETPNPEYDSTKSYYDNNRTKWVKQPNPNFNHLHNKAVEDFRSALNAVGDEEWKELVGDHCIVMIDRKGIHVEEYDHD